LGGGGTIDGGRSKEGSTGYVLCVLFVIGVGLSLTHYISSHSSLLSIICLTPKEIELKVNLAKRAGVTLTMLEPTDGGGDVVYNNNNMNVTATNTASTFNPTIGVSGRNSWFGPEDAVDLEMEFQLLKNKQSDVVNGEGGEGKDSNTASMNEDNVPPRFVNGKLTSLEQLMGISVGSAGGWSLEVYPGDFVVHR
jgi:hypothetical protein